MVISAVSHSFPVELTGGRANYTGAAGQLDKQGLFLWGNNKNKPPNIKTAEMVRAVNCSMLLASECEHCNIQTLTQD